MGPGLVCGLRGEALYIGLVGEYCGLVGEVGLVGL